MTEQREYSPLEQVGLAIRQATRAVQATRINVLQAEATLEEATQTHAAASAELATLQWMEGLLQADAVPEPEKPTPKTARVKKRPPPPPQEKKDE